MVWIPSDNIIKKDLIIDYQLLKKEEWDHVK